MFVIHTVNAAAVQSLARKICIRPRRMRPQPVRRWLPCFLQHCRRWYNHGHIASFILCKMGLVVIVLGAESLCVAEASDSKSDAPKISANQTEATTVFKSFIESPPIIRSLVGRIDIRGTSYRLQEPDLLDLPSFLVHLKQPPDALWAYLGTNLARSTCRLLSNYNAGGKIESTLTERVLQDLNELIETRPLYSTQRCVGINVSKEAIDAFSSKLIGPELARANRNLLVEAYSHEITGRSHDAVRSLLVEVRYQPTGFFEKVAPTREALLGSFVVPIGRKEMAAGFMAADSLAAGWHNNECWKISGGVLTTEMLPERPAGDACPALVRTPLMLCGRILSMGLPAPRPGLITWSGNTAAGRDPLGYDFTGEIEQNEAGRPVGMHVVYPSFPVSQGVTRVAKVDVTYEYGTNLHDWPLPTKIRVGTNWSAEILSVEFARRPQAPSRFGYYPFLNHDSRLLMVSRRENGRDSGMKYDDLMHGRRRFGGVWLTKQQIRSGGYFTFCVATASIVAMAVATEKRKKNKTNIPIT
jgi:hypothetical protein